MKYLRKFATQNDVLMIAKPNVVYVEDTKSVLYNEYGGVLIQHIDGRLFTTEAWSAEGFSNDEANGVAVLANEASFVISKTTASTSGVYWASQTSVLVEGILTTTSEEEAKTDYAGVANTDLILAVDSSQAAYKCSNYAFPNGAKGYLPALGEWLIVYNNITNIESALTLINGTTLGQTRFWSSTQSDKSKAWSFRCSTGAPENTAKAGYLGGIVYYARAFAPLNL